MKLTKLLVIFGLLAIVILGCDNRSLEIKENIIDNVYVENDTIEIVAGNTQNGSEIVVTIVDEDGSHPVGENVRFRTDLGGLMIIGNKEISEIQIDEETDENGIAKVYFYEKDIPGLAEIEISVFGDKETVQVMIIEPE